MDDVHRLRKSAVEDSYLFVVDSRMRDTSVYPSPSQYAISFASPFHNVFGLDLVDATVARTEYIVESNCNVLEYVMNAPTALTGATGRAWNQGEWATAATDATGAATGKRAVALDPGDYNMPQFIEHLNAKLAEAALAHGEPPVKCVAETNPSEITNRVLFTCHAPFTFLMGSSTLRHTLGFGDPVSLADAQFYRVVPGWSVNRTGGASDVFVSKTAGAVLDVDPRPATIGPLPGGYEVQYVAVYGSRVARQHFGAQTTGPATHVAAYVYATAGAPALAVRVARESDGATVATGTLVASPEDPNGPYVPVSCELTQAAPGVLVEAGVQYFVEFAAQGGGGVPSEFTGIYYNSDNLPTEPTRFITVDGEAVHPGANMCVDVSCASYGYSMTSPGLVNLTGPRYVNIRCPNIESHMFRDRVNEPVHVGLGMVKLRGYGYREQRFDFVSFPPRRFHPIGRLTKLDFRLERPDGSLYDSHGVDHTLLLVVRFYSPPAKDAGGGETTGTTRLNPDYVPDLREYLTRQRWPAEAAAGDRTAARY